MRILFSLLALVGGVVLGLVSYFLLSAPLGTPTNEAFSNPRMPSAPTLFVASIALVFLSPILYELLSGKPTEAN